MKKILISLLIGIILFTACRKQVDTNHTDEILGAPPPCSGNTWLEIPNYPWASTTAFPRNIFVYQNKAYVPWKDEQKVYIYDGSSWSSISSAVPVVFAGGFCFTIGDKGYLGRGGSGAGTDFWEYNIVTNTWTQMETFPGTMRYNSTSFVIANKAYIVGGANSSNYFRDVWEYDPADATPWTQKANIPNTFFARSGSSGFSIGTKGYLACGNYKTAGSPFTLYSKTLLEYNPSSDSWTQKADFPGPGMFGAASFVIGNNGYVGGGNTGPGYSKIYYKYSQSYNSWATIADMPEIESNPIGFAFNSKGYVGGYMRLMKYNPWVCFGSTPL